MSHTHTLARPHPGSTASARSLPFRALHNHTLARPFRRRPRTQCPSPELAQKCTLARPLQHLPLTHCLSPAASGTLPCTRLPSLRSLSPRVYPLQRPSTRRLRLRRLLLASRLSSRTCLSLDRLSSDRRTSLSSRRSPASRFPRPSWISTSGACWRVCLLVLRSMSVCLCRLALCLVR